MLGCDNQLKVEAKLVHGGFTNGIIGYWLCVTAEKKDCLNMWPIEAGQVLSWGFEKDCLNM